MEVHYSYFLPVSYYSCFFYTNLCPRHC